MANADLIWAYAMSSPARCGGLVPAIESKISSSFRWLGGRADRVNWNVAEV